MLYSARRRSRTPPTRSESSAANVPNKFRRGAHGRVRLATCPEANMYERANWTHDRDGRLWKERMSDEPTEETFARTEAPGNVPEPPSPSPCVGAPCRAAS